MILDKGELDTREEVQRPGPYCDGMAVILDRIYMEGFSDEIASNQAGDGGARIGRRILWWDSNGFLVSARFKDESAAERALYDSYPPDADDVP